MTAVMLLLLGFLWVASHLTYCNIYPYLFFAYPLVFGTAGVILGGQVTLQGKLIEPFPWAFTAGGGVACALIGFAIAYYAKAQECNRAQYSMVITDIPSSLSAAPGQFAPDIVIPEYDTRISAVAFQGSGYEKDLTITFDASSRFILNLHILRLKGNKYEFYRTCILTFETSAPPSKDMQVISRERTMPRFSFDKNYFQRLDETSKSGSLSKYENNCLSARMLNSGVNPRPISPPFYIDIKGGDGARVSFEQKETIKTAEAPDLAAPEINKTADAKIPFPVEKKPAQTTAQVETGTLDPKLIEMLQARKTQKVASAANTITIPAITPLETPKPIEVKIVPPPASAPPGDPQPPSKTCSESPPAATAALIERFIGGDDLDYPTRKSFYSNWDAVHCHVISILFDTSKSVAQRARALKLVTLGLSNTDDRKWQPGGRTYRNFGDSIPLLNRPEEDYIFALTQSNADALREQALLFVRTLPADSIAERLTKAAERLDRTTQPHKERYAITAAYFYYNRIAEYLNETPSNTIQERAVIRDQVKKYTASASFWLKNDLFSNGSGSASSYRAMLAYVTALVEREKKLTADAGRSNFAKMLSELRQSSEGYPSRFLHIAQALAFTNPSQSQAIMDRVKKATEYPPAVFIDEKLLPPSPGAIFVGPGQFDSISEDFKLNKSVRLLMQFEDWDLVLGNGEVGWMQRQSATAAK
jgi:hypothetical protein